MQRAIAAMSTVLLLAAVETGAQLITIKDQQLQDGRSVTLSPATGEPELDVDELEGRCKDLLKLAASQIEKKQWGEARRYLDRARTCIVTSELADAHLKLATEVNDAGMTILSDVNELYQQGEYGPVLRKLRGVSVAFGDLPAGKLADKAIRKLRDRPEVKAYFDENKASRIDLAIERILRAYGRNDPNNPRVRRQREKAMQSLDPNDPNAPDPNAPTPSRVQRILALPVAQQARVVKFLDRVMELYPATETGRRAAEDLDELATRDGFQKELRDYLARRERQTLLSSAESYKRSGSLKLALETLQKVVEKYPESEEAARAKELRAEWTDLGLD